MLDINPVKSTASLVPNLASSITRNDRIRFSACRLWFYPSSFVFSRLQRLHRASVAKRRDLRMLPAAKAAAGYRNGLTNALAFFWMAPESARIHFHADLLDVIAKSKSFDGLESLFFTASNAVGKLREAEATKKGADLWAQFGPPAQLGGGATFSLLIDTSANSVSFLNAAAVSSLGPHGPNASMLTDQNIGGLTARLQEAGLFDAGVAQDGDNTCVGIFTAVGAVCGFVAGAFMAAETAGAATTNIASLASFGGTVGGAAGLIVCGHSDSSPAAVAADAGVDSGQGADSSQDDGSQTSSDDGQSVDTSQDSGADAGANDGQSVDTSQDSSGGSSSGGDDNGSGTPDPDGSGGMPNPDDPGGLPDPDDPKGFSAVSGTLASAAAVASMVTPSAAGTFLCAGVPQLAANGSIAQAGFLAGAPGLATQHAQATASQAQIDVATVSASLGNIAVPASIAAQKAG
jgi:hypothetical protein